MLTTHHEIVEYWANNRDECGLSVDWAEAEELCWRCAQKRILQRCHITLRSLGGSEDPSNLILLCAQCHSEAPNVADPNFMWTWLRAHTASFYGTYWQLRGVREYEFIYGSKPFSGITNTEELENAVREIVKEILPECSVHWSQGKLNPATWAWVFRSVERRLANDA